MFFGLTRILSYTTINLNRFANGYTVSVPAHGTVLIKVGKPSSAD